MKQTTIFFNLFFMTTFLGASSIDEENAALKKKLFIHVENGSLPEVEEIMTSSKYVRICNDPEIRANPKIKEMMGKIRNQRQAETLLKNILNNK